MRRAIVALLLLVAAVGHAEPRRFGPDLDVFIPIEPEEHERLYFRSPRKRNPIPGTVTINRPPYVCDLDRETFTDRERFAAHLVEKHRVPWDQIGDLLFVVDGQVHFGGE